MSTIHVRSHAPIQLVNAPIPKSPQPTENAKTADQAPPPSSAPSSRPRRSISNIIGSQIHLKAKSLVQKGDEQIAVQAAKTLMKWMLANENNTGDTFQPYVHEVPSYSSFGHAWNRLSDALEAEPFLSFAKHHKMESPYIQLNPGTGDLTVRCNGVWKTFTLSSHPDWARVSQKVLAALKDVAAGSREDVFFEGKRVADYQTVANYYGNNPKESIRNTLSQLISSRSFESLDERNAQNPEYAAARKRQQDAVSQLENLDRTQFDALFFPSTDPAPTSQVDEADRELAQICSALLLTLHPETRGPGFLATTELGRVPEFSTFAQTRSALFADLTGDAVTAFLKKHDTTELSGHAIDPASGQLTVYDNKGVRRIFTLEDTSGWKDISASILEKVRRLAAGTNEYIQPDPSYSVKLDQVLNFYGQPPAGNSLKAIIQEAEALLGKDGFPALHREATPAHPKAAEVQASQQAVKQQLVADALAVVNPPHAASTEADPVAKISRHLFDGAPGLDAAVTQLLGQAIKRVAPGLDVDVNQLAFATPDPQTPGQFVHTPLTELVLNHIAGGEPPTFGDQGKFVDTRPDLLAHTGNAPGASLAIDKTALERALRELPGKVNETHRSALLKYWSESPFSKPAPGLNPDSAVSVTPLFAGDRRTLIADMARSNLLLASLKHPGLDDLQRETLQHVIKYPKGADRPALAEQSTVNVYMFTTAARSGLVDQRFLMPTVVIERTLQDRTIILACGPGGQVTPYDSLDTARQALEQTFRAQNPSVSAQNSLMKTEADVFQTQTSIIVNQQLHDALATAPVLLSSTQAEQPQRKTAEWITNANDAERITLRDLSLELASYMQRNKERTYNSDIPDLRTYLNEQLSALSPRPFTDDINDLEVVFHTPVGTLGSGYIEPSTMPLADAFIQNLAGLPIGRREVRHKVTKVRIPELEKEGALNELIQKIDIGKNYPALLKRELLDTPAKRAERQSLFAQQIPIELQIKALELTAKGESGFDNAMGFRYLKAVLDPKPGAKMVDGKQILMRPLAFVREPGATPDVVENMYLIEPKDSTLGPHLLYRPLMADAPLQQFPSRQALMEAIQKPGKLQRDILAWLPDDLTRAIYANGGFSEPHLRSRNVVDDDFSARRTPAAPTLAIEGAALTELESKLSAGELMKHLYEANAKALATLAEQQSVSTSESRWATLKAGGFLVLNAVLPVLRGPAAFIGLTLQLGGILGDINTLASDTESGKEAAATDLLINLAALLLHARLRQQPEPIKTGTSQSVTCVGDFPAITSANSPLREVIRMGGPWEDVKAIDGDIQTFVDTHKGAPRLNILGHAEKPEPGKPARIVGANNKSYSAKDILEKLKTENIDLSKFKNISLRVCYSGANSPLSLGDELYKLTNIRTKSFEGPLDISYYRGKDPRVAYNVAYRKLKAKYPHFSHQEIKRLADTNVSLSFAKKNNFSISVKETGTPIEINIGSHEKPKRIVSLVDYRPRYSGPDEPPALASSGTTSEPNGTPTSAGQVTRGGEQVALVRLKERIVGTNIQKDATPDQIDELKKSSNGRYLLKSINPENTSTGWPDGPYDFVIRADEPEKLYLGSVEKGLTPQGNLYPFNSRMRPYNIEGHSGLANGLQSQRGGTTDVLFAGTIYFKAGKPEFWTNASGHYLPPAELRHTNLSASIKTLLPDEKFVDEDDLTTAQRKEWYASTRLTQSELEEDNTALQLTYNINTNSDSDISDSDND